MDIRHTEGRNLYANDVMSLTAAWTAWEVNLARLIEYPEIFLDPVRFAYSSENTAAR